MQHIHYKQAVDAITPTPLSVMQSNTTALYAVSKLTSELHGPFSDLNFKVTKYVVCPCPLERHIEVFSDLMPLSAGQHHLSMSTKTVTIHG